MRLKDIQPDEIFLKRPTVEYFLRHPKMLFKKKDKIRIVRCEEAPFPYAAVNGNHRLFVCYLLGMENLPLHPEENLVYRKGFLELESCLGAYKVVQTWADLEYRVVSISEYAHRNSCRKMLEMDGCGTGLITLRKIYKPRSSL